MFIQRKKIQCQQQQALHHLISWMGIGITLGLPSWGHAQDYSYAQAEQQLLNHSYSTQASTALQHAAQLEADAVKGLGLPRIDLNARAYAFHSEVDIPLNQVKQSIEENLSQRVSDRLSALENIGVPANILDQVGSTVNSLISEGIGQLPNTANLTLQDQVLRPTVSVSMPLYLGGLTQTAKRIASINAQRSELSNIQQQNLQRFELIQDYFLAQLQTQLLDSSAQNLQAMQQHVEHALKLEQQGFISKGQRMQFEVARNNALRLHQNQQNNVNAAQFQLKNLLQDSSLEQLSTPLFVNTTHNTDIQALLDHFAERSPTIQKLNMDTALATEKINAQRASQKPKIFAFGEYALDNKQNWIVGVMASYNLFSGVDKNKQVQAAELQRYAAELIKEQTKQEMSNVLYTAYQQLQSAQFSHQLLKQNMQAAQENLRIQKLSFQEDMGTATQVIDAENMLYTLNSEQALNAYRYIMALATLLQSSGDMQQFSTYIQKQHTDFIGKKTYMLD